MLFVLGSIRQTVNYAYFRSQLCLHVLLFPFYSFNIRETLCKTYTPEYFITS